MRRFVNSKRDARSWRVPLLKVLWVGVFLAELLGSSEDSSLAQNALKSRGDGLHDSELETKAGGSSSTHSTTRAAAQTGDRYSEMGGCPTQQPFLLKKYKSRPSWRVAGVDYCVGYPKTLTLVNPSTISTAGVTVNTSTHIVTIIGDNIALSGYDFSGGGGWGVVVQGSNDTIANSNFVVGSNSIQPITGAASASNLNILDCTIDGAGNDPGPNGALIAYHGSGLTIEYSWLKNSGGDMIQQVDGGAGSTITIQHNLIQNAGMSPGAHGDYTQLAGGPFTVAINYNTTTQNGGATQGLMTEFVSQGQITNNTMMGTVSYFTSVDLSSLTGTMEVANNYFDDSQGYGFVYPNSGPNDSSPLSVFVHNVNMINGALKQDSNAAAEAVSLGISSSSSTTKGN